MVNRIQPKNSNTKTKNTFWRFKLGKSTQIRNFYLPTVGLRITLLNNESKIAYEYDFIQKRFLSRQEALSKNEWSKTLRYFRIKKGMENYHDNRKTTYLISDLHLDHANIIKYCSRPFLLSDVDEMNMVLVNNWNNTVKRQHNFFLRRFIFWTEGQDLRTHG